VTYISLAHRNSEIVVITDMDAFANYFCFAKKQKQGRLVSDTIEDEDAQPSEDIEPEGKALDDDDTDASSGTSDEDDDI
jgi:hypothetical protein